MAGGAPADPVGPATRALAEALLAAAAARVAGFAGGLGDGLGDGLGGGLGDGLGDGLGGGGEAGDLAALAERADLLEAPLRQAGFVAAVAASALGIAVLGDRRDEHALGHLLAFAPEDARRALGPAELAALTAASAQRLASGAVGEAAESDPRAAWGPAFALALLALDASRGAGRSRVRRGLGRGGLELVPPPSAALRDEVQALDPAAGWRVGSRRALWVWRTRA